jgi:oligoendopeptidase F
MLSDTDTRVSEPQGMQQEMQQIFAQFGAEASFVEPELLKVGSATVEKFIAAEPRLKIYTFYLRDIVRRAPHTLSDAEEKLLADASPLAGSASNIYGILTNADFPYPTITLSDGRSVKVDQSGYSELRTSKNRDDRKAAMSAFFTSLGTFSRTFGTTINSKRRRCCSTPKRGSTRRTSRVAGPGEHSGVGLHAAGRGVNKNLPTFHRYSEAAQTDDGDHRRPPLLRPLRAARVVGGSALRARGGAEARARGGRASGS